VTDTKRPQRRWCQYSLRTLLLLTAALAVWLGHVTGSARRQQAAVEVLGTLPANIFYDHELAEEGLQPCSLGQLYYIATGRNWTGRRGREPPGPKWLQDRIGEDYFRTLVAVQFGGYAAPHVTGEHLRCLSGLDHFRMLGLDRAERLTNDDLVHLRPLGRLQRLFLAETQITDAGLAHLSGLANLRYLSLADTKITDEGLIHLQGLKNLEMLELCGTDVSDAGLKHLKGLKKLGFLYVYSTKVTQKGAKELEAALPGCWVLLTPPETIF